MCVFYHIFVSAMKAHFIKLSYLVNGKCFIMLNNYRIFEYEADLKQEEISEEQKIVSWANDEKCLPLLKLAQLCVLLIMLHKCKWCYQKTDILSYRPTYCNPLIF